MTADESSAQHRRTYGACRRPDAEIVVDVGSLTEPDLVVVDALARMHLEARRRGATIEMRDAPDALRDLLNWIGLDDVLLGNNVARGQPCRQTEPREQVTGVEEGVNPRDPPR